MSKTILRQEAYFVYLMFFIFQYFVRYFNVFKQRLFSSLMMLERLVLELDVMLIGVKFSINTVISFLKQNGNGSRPEMYLEPTRMWYGYFAKSRKPYLFSQISSMTDARMASKYALEDPDKKTLVVTIMNLFNNIQSGFPQVALVVRGFRPIKCKNKASAYFYFLPFTFTSN